MLSIGKVAKKISTPEHTIRLWTDSFPHIKCTIGKGKRRYYDEVALSELKKVNTLINEKGMTIKSIQSLVKYNKIKEDVSKLIATKQNPVFNINNALGIINEIKKLTRII